jgi:membrane dipeptidase
VASEGADFLEGHAERVDEFHERFGLRHLQLTHYRVNELGDIQTVPPVHGGLTAFGRAVVRRCEARGIVVDVAHAPLATVRGVVEATDRPIVLSHTSLSANPTPYSRLISPEHARLVAATGGVIGVWPPASRFPSMAAFAGGFRAMVDAVGVDHVGLGSDMLGLTGPSIFGRYDDLPRLRQALADAGFRDDEVARLLGGNYARVFSAAIR